MLSSFFIVYKLISRLKHKNYTANEFGQDDISRERFNGNPMLWGKVAVIEEWILTKFFSLKKKIKNKLI